MILLYVLYALVGISIIIFFHEAGHFFAAKKVGVRVERFSLGFDPPVRGRNLRFFSFRRGETLYVLGAIPFGGYVKLAGEVVPEEGKTPAPDELLSKSVGARALVFVAGSVMNILSAFLFFIVAFTLGVDFPEPQVGSAVPGSPAWEAGIRTGDTLLSVDGGKVVDFTEVRLSVALARRSKPLDIEFNRPSGEGRGEIQKVTVVPRWNADGFNEIGLRPSFSEVLDSLKEGSPLERAGLRKGDRILSAEVAGQVLPPMHFTLLFDAVGAFNASHPDEPFKLLARRDGRDEWYEVVPRKDSGQEKPQLGVLRGQGNVVRAIQPGSAAAGSFQARDEVYEVNGQPLHTVEWPRLLEHAKAEGGRLNFQVRSPEGERTVSVSWDDFLGWNLRGEIFWGVHALAAVELKAGIAASGIREGDVLTEVNGKACYALQDVEDALADHASALVPVILRRAGMPVDLQLDRAALEKGGDITWSSLPPLAGVLPGSPAQAAGIRPGSRLLSFQGQKLYSWDDILTCVSRQTPGSEVRIEWREPEGALRAANVQVAGSRAPEPILFPVSFVERTVRAGVIESFGLGAKRTLVVSKQIFLTLKSLLRRDVSARNLAGPVGIVHQFTVVLEHGKLSVLIYWLAIISVNLGLFNLLPFPILDGGHILFLAIEKIKGSPVNIRVQEWATNIAFLLIMFLALFVTFNDIKRALG